MTQRRNFAWMDLLWLAFLAGLAALAPRPEIHKQLILIAIGVFQIFEYRFPGMGSRTRAVLQCVAENPAGVAAGGSHGRNFQQLLSDLFPARGYGGHVLRSLGHAGLDRVDFGGLLVLRDLGAERI